MAINIITTAVAMQGGVTAVAGVGDNFLFTFGGVWAQRDTYTVTLTDQTTAVQTQVGAGFITGVLPTFCLTYGNKVYILGGATTYCSAVALPTVFNNPNATGNGFVAMSDWFSTSENLVAIAPYQGRLAFFSRHTVQIWGVSPLIVNWQQIQVLQNIGTMAPLSVQPVGDLDVMFLSDTGVRSLKVHDSSLNAFVNDTGSPIDKLIQTAFLASGDHGASACGVVDPESGRYILYLQGTIYVFSYYPTSKILAWSTYLPTYQDGNGVQQTFTPQKFLLSKGQVLCLATIASGASVVFVLGGANHNTYDNCTATVIFPFFDSKTPGTWKQSTGIDVVVQGAWSIYGSMDYLSGQYTKIADVVNPTADLGTIGFTGQGTHISLKVTTNAATGLPTIPTLSSALWHYELGNETA